MEVGEEAYAFPLAHIERMCDLAPEDIVQVEGRQHFWHEGQHVGLVAASQLLNRPASQSSGETLKVVVIRERDAVYGVAVERFIGERTLVVLPLDERLGKVQDISAGALLDDGSVVLIVDVEDMLRSVDKLLNTGRLERKQELAELLQTLQVGCGAIHEGARATVRADDASQDAIVVCIERLLQARTCGGMIADIELSGDVCAIVPSRTSPALPRSPSTRARASTRMDLPAPVSPVSTVIPVPNSTSTWSTMAKFLTWRLVSIGLVCVLRVRHALATVATPMQLRAQDLVVVVARWVDQADALLCVTHQQPIFRQQFADRVAIDGNLRLGVGALHNLHLNLHGRGHYDRSIAERVRADWHQHDCIKRGFDDRAAAAQRVGGRTGRRCDDQPVAGMRVYQPAADACFEIHHAETHLRDGDGPQRMVEHTVYGECRPDPEALNLRGAVFQSFDGAGVVTNEAYDFKGNLLRSTRRLAADYRTIPDWSGDVLLDEEAFAGEIAYDALNRPIALTMPDTSIVRPGFNEAGLLQRLDVKLPAQADDGDASWNAFVTDIAYNARGQRTVLRYGNGVATRYRYDAETFRLVTLYTRRHESFSADCGGPPPPPRYPAPETAPQGQPCGLQNLHYTYDPVGNLTHVRDSAQQTLFFRNHRVEPTAEFTYDAVYRLIEASGREHLGQSGMGVPLPPVPSSPSDAPRVNLQHPGDGNAMGRYVQRYVYDQVGNLLQMIHRGTDPGHPGWTRGYEYSEPNPLDPGKPSNRLSATSVGLQPRSGYEHDAHGNITAMPHLSLMAWDHRDRLSATTRQVVNGDGLPETTYYTYDAGGQRVRKVTVEALTPEQAAAGMQPRRKAQTISLNGFETCREYAGDGVNVIFERDTLHVMDDQQRIAMVESRTSRNEPMTHRLVRYQLGNHLGSACLELDADARIISYEEYFPYGSTSYQAMAANIETPKRYRFTGKERDSETGFNYHARRYYAPWLGRWTSADPAQTRGQMSYGLNSYDYAAGSPTGLTDDSGLDADSPSIDLEDVIAAESRQAAFDAGKDMQQEYGNKRLLGAEGKAKTRLSSEQGRKTMQKLQENLAEGSKLNRYPGASRRLVPEVNIKEGVIRAAGGNPKPGGRNPDLVVTKSEMPGKDAPKEWRSLEGKGTDVLEKKTYDVKVGGDYVRDKPGFRAQTGLDVKEVRPFSKTTLDLGPTAKQAKVLPPVSPSTGSKLGKLAKKGAKVIPFVGMGAGAYAMYDALEKGDYGTAALEAVGFVPVLGDYVDLLRLSTDVGSEIGSGAYDLLHPGRGALNKIGGRWVRVKEAGIEGFFEIRDDESGEILKVTRNPWKYRSL